MKNQSGKHIQIALLLLAGAVSVQAEISIDLNAYTPPEGIISNTIARTSGGAVNALSGNAFLNDTGTDSEFKVFGSTGTILNTQTGTLSYASGVYNDGGGNYLRLQSVREASGGNPLMLVASAGNYPLSDNWRISTVFSFKPADGHVAQGNVFLGLYGAGAELANGGYNADYIQTTGNTLSEVALQLWVTTAGAGRVATTDATNGHTTLMNFANNTFDVTGAVKYSAVFSVSDGVLNIAVTNQTTLAEIANVNLSAADLGSNIGPDVRFAAGDLGNNTTYNWDLMVHTLSFKSLAAPQPALKLVILSSN